jgi:two-component system, OmpR family, sensor histidine kinase ArlS
MTKKLLNKTLNSYLIFSVIVIILIAPLFYFITNKLYIEEADEILPLRKKEFLANNLGSLKESDIVIWNKINRDIKIEKPLLNLSKDSIFYQSYYDTLSNENEPYRVLYAPINIQGKPYTFVAKINLLENEGLIKSIALLFIVLIILLLIGFYFITKKLSTKLWKPFYETLNKIKQFEVDKNATTSFDETDIEEFNSLNNAISKLIEKNTLIYQNQREFIENAAHELQTPLAVFQGKIDELMQRFDITEGQSDIICSLNETNARLNKLNKNLLLLSKIESNQYLEIENVSVNDIVSKQLIFFNEQAISKHIAIDLKLENDIKVHANQMLTEVLISNLFLNAIKHNVIDGKIAIRISQNAISFINTGLAETLDKNKLFQRFSKVNPSSQGNGLGLAIIKKITQLNAWSVDYNYQNQLHTFSIRF